MKLASHLISFFLIFLLVIPGVLASDQPKTTVSGTWEFSDSDSPPNHSKISYEYTVSSGTFVVTPGEYLSVIVYSLKLDNIPQHYYRYVQGVGSDKYDLSEIYVSLTLRGPRNYEFTFEFDPATSVSLSSSHSKSTAYKDVNPGLYYWKLYIKLTYKFGDVVKEVSYTSIQVFSDTIVVKYSESGDWGRDINTGINTALGIFTTIWSNVGTKITDIDWGGALMNFDFIGLIGDFLLLFGIIGYAFFEMFTMPVTALSLITSHTANPMTVSFFILAIVGVFLVLLLFWVVIWKVIMLIKP